MMADVPAVKEAFVASQDLLSSFYEQTQLKGIDVLRHI